MIKKIKVAHVIRVFSYGGAEISLKELLLAKRFKDNCNSDLFILDHKKLGLLTYVKDHVEHVYHYRITTLLFIYEYMRFLHRIVVNRYTIVHMHLPVAGWMTIIAKLFCSKTKFVYTEHSLVSFYSKYNFYLAGFTYRFYDSVVSVSQEVSDEIARQQLKWFYKRRHAVTVLNGVNTERFFVPGRKYRQPLVVGLVARFRRHKRIDRWIEVAEAIHDRNRDIKFMIVGNGPDEHLIRKRVVEKNLVDVIEFVGQTNDTVNAYRQIDIFLLTSELEGLPLSLMEAMSCGCVPAVNNIGGIKQLDFKDVGFKFNEFDAINIAEKIVSYTEQPGKFFTESQMSREFAVRYYSLNKQVKDIIDLYHQLLGNAVLEKSPVREIVWQKRKYA